MSWSTLMTHISKRILRRDGKAIGGLKQVWNWRNSKPPENTREVRLPGRCRPNMLATSSSYHNRSHKFKAGTLLRLCERSEIKITPCKFLST